MDYGKLFLHISLVWGIVSLLLLLLAWRRAARRNKTGHGRLMVILTAGAWLFILSYLLRYFIPGYTSPAIPHHLIPWFALHGTVGLLPLFGATALVHARSRSPEKGFLNRTHKRLGRMTASLWCFTHLGGIINFWLLG